MALSRKKPIGYPEISFLSFDVLALLAKLQQEMGLDSVGPVSFSLQTMETLACVRWEHGKPGGDIFFHSLFVPVQGARRLIANFSLLNP